MTSKFFSIVHNTNRQVLYLSIATWLEVVIRGRPMSVHLALIYKVYEYRHA